jgi:hypothetical protein
MKRLVLAIALAWLGHGCATIDVYDYEPRALPSGIEPLAAVADSLRDLRNVSWNEGMGDPDPSRRATLAPSATGVTVRPRAPMVTASPLDLSYGEIASGVRMVTALHGSWTIYLYDRHSRLVQMEFGSYHAARLFLDAASALARA